MFIEHQIQLFKSSNAKEALSMNEKGMLRNDNFYNNYYHLYVTTLKEDLVEPNKLYIKNGLLNISENYTRGYLVLATSDPKYILLPKLSDNFKRRYVKEFNIGNQIENILVEFDYIITNEDFSQHPVKLDGYPKLKVNKNNQVSIKKNKYTFTKEEVSDLLINCIREFSCEKLTNEMILNYLKNVL